jgi:hypothetical protein|tara:strand:- start:163 stop:336 length:174 start_codon:yes stop_codon:yes gene_type:complete
MADEFRRKFRRLMRREAVVSFMVQRLLATNMCGKQFGEGTGEFVVVGQENNKEPFSS